MCGRTSLFIPLQELEDRFDARVVTDGGYQPRFNVAPGDPLEVITNEDTDAIDQYTWGLVPQWMDAPDEGFINARSETAREKPAFRHAWAKRPCLVLTSGFYEWQKQNGGPKQPYRIFREDDPAFALAGLWEEWRDDDGHRLRTVTILTTDSNGVVDPIHDRMPVVLPREDESRWLTTGIDERRELCRPYSGDDLAAYPISTAVNNPSNEDARVIEPLETKQTDFEEFA
ncbi:SOS response-associated peptidase [Natronococcus wangiae]|uniref:SOS response-associated peptidase n=1 Tax=Natronococcus wangiae TaxID=3068275 RepID=UPI00273ECD07|nr:SOS response-associated peptidase [Natronococcus sp. AD5]